MDTILATNAIKPNQALQEDPGWIIAQAGKQEAVLFVESGNTRLALFQGNLTPRLVNNNDPHLIVGRDTYDYEILNFTFNKPGNLQDCTGLRIARAIIYGIPEVDGSREKLTTAHTALAANAISDQYTRQRKRYIITTNTLHIRVGGVSHAIEIFPYHTAHWLTLEELLDIFRDRLYTYLSTFIDPAAIVDLRISTDGYIELVWESLIANIEMNVSDVEPHNNIWSLLHSIFYVHAFTSGVVDLSIGMTAGYSLKLYPTREALSDNASAMFGGNIVLFSSTELTQFMVNDNIVSGGTSACCGIGVLDQRGLDPAVVAKRGIWDFNTVGKANLISNKMRFDSDRITDTFQVSISVATRVDANGVLQEAFEVAISKYLPQHRIRMLLFAEIY